ncbi:expressed unknown protein [Seminavis robusta]|uniref:Uncharacterized protein n=1 Tax=Seminavis robusta TaxID=568900 RepID=A0A9N8EJU9_9STRA|nr:expressed unknown protein [Seminavis robusta]|eukprot:Sro1301_g260800.1 n/a (735) ;mRNA; f:11118-13819
MAEEHQVEDGIQQYHQPLHHHEDQIAIGNGLDHQGAGSLKNERPVDSFPALVPYASCGKGMDATSVHTKSTCAETKSLSDSGSSFNAFSRRSSSVYDGSTSSFADMNTTNHSTSTIGTASRGSFCNPAASRGNSHPTSSARYGEAMSASCSGRHYGGRESRPHREYTVRRHQDEDHFLPNRTRCHSPDAHDSPLFGSSRCRESLDGEGDGSKGGDGKPHHQWKRGALKDDGLMRDNSLDVDDLYQLGRRGGEPHRPPEPPREWYSRSSPTLVRSSPVLEQRSRSPRDPVLERSGPSKRSMNRSSPDHHASARVHYGDSLDESSHNVSSDSSSSNGRSGVTQRTKRSGGSPSSQRHTSSKDTRSERGQRRRFLEQTDRGYSGSFHDEPLACGIPIEPKVRETHRKNYDDHHYTDGPRMGFARNPHGRSETHLGASFDRSPRTAHARQQSERGFNTSPRYAAMTTARLESFSQSMPSLYPSVTEDCLLVGDRPYRYGVDEPHDVPGSRPAGSERVFSVREGSRSRSPPIAPQHHRYEGPNRAMSGSGSNESSQSPNLVMPTTHIDSSATESSGLPALRQHQRLKDPPRPTTSASTATPTRQQQQQEQQPTLLDTSEAREQIEYIDIAPGVRAALRSAKETKAAIVNDYYVPKICFGCSLDLFCIQDVEYFVCPVCKVVNPMGENEGVRNQEDFAPATESIKRKKSGAAMGFTFESLFEMQAEIMKAEESSSLASSS